MITLSDSFRRRIASVWGREGEEWLERLPMLIRTCAERWALDVHAPLPTLSYNFAASVLRADGTEAVLKIGVPDKELMTEIEALRAYRDKPAVELLAADRQLGALLLRRVKPGTPLSSLQDDEEATLIAARLMRELPVPEPAEHRFPTLGQWALAFGRLRDRFAGKTGPLPSRLVEKAERLFQELQASASRKMLLHGDLHHDNILFDDENGWLAIDPKGVIGELAYEAARLQHNPIPRFLSMDHSQGVIQRRAEILASALQEDRGRLLAWAFFDVVLAACWSVEEEADDVGYFLACAELLDALVE